MRAMFALAVAVVAAAERPPESAGVVRVDLIASDAGGRVVESLEPADFDLTENGVAQTLDSVRFVKIDGQSAAAGEAAPVRSDRDEQEQAAHENTRLFAFFLDEYHVSAGPNTDRVRQALGRVVDRDLGPRDLVAVMKPLDSLLAIRLTRDREVIRHAIDSFEGRRGEYEPRNAFEKNFLAGAPARIEPVRTQVATSALNALVLHLGTLNEGRKTLVLVSEGLTEVGRHRGLETLPTVETVIRAANRYNVAIYAVNPRNSAAAGEIAQKPGSGPGEVESLRALTDLTDGLVIVDPKDLDGGMRRIVNDSSAYYLLAYRSVHPSDGRFREVHVRVKRPGITVRARKGYWALSPDEALAAKLLARGDEPSVRALPPGFDVPQRISPLIRAWFGVSRGEAGKTRVTFVWEPVARVPGDRRGKGEPSRIVLGALAPDGTSVFDGPVLATGSGAPDSPDAGTARAVFDVAPGRLRLRMSIEDAASQAIDSDVRDVSIRDLKGAVALGSAEILRTRNAREFRALDADPDAPPVASREFRRTDHLILRVPAYAPDGPPKVSARLMSRMGQAMRDLPVKAPAAPGGRYQIDLPLAGLAPGEYLIELTASSVAGQVKDLLGLRVTN